MIKATLCVLAAVLAVSAAQCDLTKIQEAQGELVAKATACTDGQDAPLLECQQKLQKEMSANLEKYMAAALSGDYSVMAPLMKTMIKCMCGTVTTVFNCFNKLDCYGADVYNVLQGADQFLGGLAEGVFGPMRRREAENPFDGLPADLQKILDDALSSCPVLMNQINPPTWKTSFALKAPSNFKELTATQAKSLCMEALNRIQPPQSISACDDDTFFKYAVQDGQIKIDLNVVSSFKPGLADLFLGQSSDFEYESTNGTATAAFQVAEIAESTSSAFATLSTLVAIAAAALLAL
jgi:hypothetical protein